jgi:glycosyltransferase involved in cell wall biosynthesis
LTQQLTLPGAEGEPASRAARPLRILTVTNQWPEGSSYRGVYVRQCVDSLRQLGHVVDVEVVAQSRGRMDHFTAVRRVRRRATSGTYDVVHVHFGMTAVAAMFSGPVPRVLTLYGSDINDRWRRWMTKAGWRGVAARIYVSRRLAETAGDPGGTVIPNGVDFELFRPVDRETARSRLGLASGRRTVLFGGDPGRPVKRYDVFRDVISAIRDRGMDVDELILSEPGQPHERVVEKLNAADLLLFTSRQGSEGSPTVVKEAAVVGLPVVAVDVGDVADVLAGVNPSAVVAFPNGVETPETRRNLVAGLADRAVEVLAAGTRSNGRERSAWLDLRSVAERVVEVYRQVAAG